MTLLQSGEGRITMLRLFRRGTVALVSTICLGTPFPSEAAGGQKGLHPEPPTPAIIATPARMGSREPNLETLPDGRVLMSWLEPSGNAGFALRCAAYDGRHWSKPSTIASGDSFFVNWADVPSVRSLGGKRVGAHWLWRSGADTYAYDVRISQSNDGGLTWSAPITPHRDGLAVEHGFASLVSDSGAAVAVWLDGRKSAGHAEDSPGPMPDMTLRSATVLGDGRLRDEAELDDRTCDCCQTAAVNTDRGILVAYRDRSPDEVRDIVVTRHEAGQWWPLRSVHHDNWRIAGCPVNGPALDARRSHVAIAWYTAAIDSPRVYVAFSEDAGDHFASPTRVDDGSPIGRVHIALLADGSALTTWLEASGHDALLRARRIRPDGASDSAFTVARTSAARASGCPRVTRSGDSIVFAWTESGAVPQVRLAMVSLK